MNTKSIPSTTTAFKRIIFYGTKKIEKKKKQKKNRQEHSEEQECNMIKVYKNWSVWLWEQIKKKKQQFLSRTENKKDRRNAAKLSIESNDEKKHFHTWIKEKELILRIMIKLFQNSDNTLIRAYLNSNNFNQFDE